MTDQTIFSADQAENKSQEAPLVSQETAPAAPSQPSIPQELQEFVGEGKKYRTLEEVYKAFPNAQKHISTLEEENRVIKEELAKRKAAQELLEDIRKGIAQKPESTNTGVEVNQDVVSEIVRKELEQAQYKQTQKANTDSVVNTFKSVYADKAEEVYNKLAQENDLSIAELNAMVARSPKAVLKLAGLTDKQSTKPAPLQSSVNTTALSHQNNSNSNVPSAKVGNFPNSKELARAWAATREKVYKDLGIKG